MTFLNGEFITRFLGDRGQSPVRPSYLAFSRDGSAWEEDGPFFDPIGGLVFGRNKYVALTHSDCTPCSALIISTNGRSWAYRPMPSGESEVEGTGIAYGNGMFVIACSRHWPLPSVMLSSRDGYNWDTFTFDGYPAFWTVTFLGDRFVAFADGLIAVSDQVPFVPLITRFSAGNNSFEFDLDAQEGTRWEVQRSDDLVQWRAVGTIEAQTEKQTFRFFETGKSGAGFLRVKRQ